MKLLYTECTEHLVEIDVNRIITKTASEVKNEFGKDADNDSLYDYIGDNINSILEELYPELEGTEYDPRYIEDRIGKILLNL